MNIEKKCNESICFLEEWTFFFDKIWTWEHRGFKKIDVFNKIWVWEHLFLREKSKKKGILLTFLPRSYDRNDVFWTKQVHDSRGFFIENFQKLNVKKQCFWENERFLTKYGHESRVFRE